jgi:predicted phage terminase large subunit-like protein
MLHQTSSPSNNSSVAATLAEALADGGWRSKARPSQLPPAGAWNGWAVVAGRGFGKSWIAANYANEMANTVGRIALIGSTAGDVRDTMIEGESGILKTAPPWFRPTYEPSKRKIEWPNGCIATCFSSEEPDRLRGPQFELGILDEFAAWSNMQETWDMFSFGLRLGKHPRWVMATTPRPSKLLREILARDDVVTTRGSTFENSDNLAPPFLEAIRRKYENTRLGRQELHAEILSDVPGSLWQLQWIDDARVKALPWDGLQRVVVAIDPATTSGEDSDETGIICAGVDHVGDGYILDDASGRWQPGEWAAKAIDLYRRHQADRIVGETNNGGDMIENVLRSIDSTIAYKGIHASRGKVTRAEPISTFYEQHRVHHLGSFPILEDQMCAFTRDHSRASTGYSPDRADALVYALTELMLTPTGPRFFFG